MLLVSADLVRAHSLTQSQSRARRCSNVGPQAPTSHDIALLHLTSPRALSPGPYQARASSGPGFPGSRLQRKTDRSRAPLLENGGSIEAAAAGAEQQQDHQQHQQQFKQQQLPQQQQQERGSVQDGAWDQQLSTAATDGSSQCHTPRWAVTPQLLRHDCMALATPCDTPFPVSGASTVPSGSLTPLFAPVPCAMVSDWVGLQVREPERRLLDNGGGLGQAQGGAAPGAGPQEGSGTQGEGLPAATVPGGFGSVDAAGEEDGEVDALEELKRHMLQEHMRVIGHIEEKKRQRQQQQQDVQHDNHAHNPSSSLRGAIDRPEGGAYAGADTSTQPARTRPHIQLQGSAGQVR